MSHKDFSNVQVMRKPDENGGIQLKKFKEIIRNKYGAKLDNYWEFHKWTVDNLAEFWAELWDFVGIISSKKFDQVIDLTIPMQECPEWFKGARLNFAENLLRYRDDRVAIISAGEDKKTKHFTFAEMFKEARLYAAAFRKFGIKKGDVVACYMSNREEALFGLQATTSIGAIWTGVLPLLGAQAVINRFKQVKPKILLTIDRYQNDQEEIEMLPKVKDIINGISSLQRVIIIPSKKESKLKNISDIKNSVLLDEFLRLGIDENGIIPPMEFEQVSFSHPVFISYTSGTTGLPKPIIHGCGALLPTTKDFWLQLDCDRDSIWFSMSPVGWVSWNMVCTLCFGGIALLLYEGFPYYLSPTYFWDLVQKHKLTNIFLPSKVLEELGKRGYFPTKEHDLSSVKTCIATGSVVKPLSYDFFYNKIKKDALFGAPYGCTEINAMCLMVDPTVATYKGESSVPALGIDIQCLDETGKHVEGEYGELVIAKPSPILLLGLWGDSDGSLMRKMYYSKFQGCKFAIGDFVIVNPVTKGYIICGRSDDTVKQRGTRFGSSEIYNVVDMFYEIQDCVCVSHYNKDMEGRAVLFLKMREGHIFDDDLIQKIRKVIAEELTTFHIPDVILQTEDIPYNMNGKKMESIVKNIINKRPYNSDSVVNPECLHNFCDISELKDF